MGVLQRLKDISYVFLVDYYRFGIDKYVIEEDMAESTDKSYQYTGH